MVDIIVKMLQIREQIQILHWQTESHARHMAYGAYYEDISEKIDEFVESYQGKYGRIKLDETTSLHLQNIRQLDLKNFLTDIIDMLTNEIPANIDNKDTDSDLLAIRDEILTLTNKLVYLLTFN